MQGGRFDSDGGETRVRLRNAARKSIFPSTVSSSTHTLCACHPFVVFPACIWSVRLYDILIMTVLTRLDSLPGYSQRTVELGLSVSWNVRGQTSTADLLFSQESHAVVSRVHIRRELEVDCTPISGNACVVCAGADMGMLWSCSEGNLQSTICLVLTEVKSLICVRRIAISRSQDELPKVVATTRNALP